MLLGVRLDPKLERQLNLLVRQQGHTCRVCPCRVCIREAIHQVRLRPGDSGEALRRSDHLSVLQPPTWSEPLPDWSDWTA